MSSQQPNCCLGVAGRYVEVVRILTFLLAHGWRSPGSQDSAAVIELKHILGSQSLKLEPALKSVRTRQRSFPNSPESSHLNCIEYYNVAIHI